MIKRRPVSVRSTNGFALLTAVWIAAILAMLTVGLASQYSANTEATRLDMLRLKHNFLHQAGIRHAALTLASNRVAVAPTGTPAHILNLNLRAGSVMIEVENEAARLDLRYVADDVLVAILSEVGLDSASTATIVQRVQALVQQGKPLTYRLLREWLESTPGAYQRLIPNVSLHNGVATVHPQLASEMVLSWLPNLAVADRQRLLLERQQQSLVDARIPNSLALVSTPVHHTMLDTRLSAYYRITVTSKVGSATRVSSEVIKMTNAEGRLYDSVARL
ncbi:hypothetical protein [Arenicella xantha]|uniref:General secretion pathway protein K n=1 Tax=Arenicella xantha TaxID=644221 RepID=A0A395JHZ1_9GAMM|nr:hypothetical protein [Arenicella xantha]RBP47141.1 hypothetical protein DFR28_10913 [Arenicella xantha]